MICARCIDCTRAVMFGSQVGKYYNIIVSRWAGVPGHHRYFSSSLPRYHIIECLITSNPIIIDSGPPLCIVLWRLWGYNYIIIVSYIPRRTRRAARSIESGHRTRASSSSRYRTGARVQICFAHGFHILHLHVTLAHIYTNARRTSYIYMETVHSAVCTRSPGTLRSGIVIRVGYCTARIYIYIYIIVANSIKCNDDTHREYSHTFARRRGRQSLLMIGPTTAAGHNNSNSNSNSDEDNIDTPCSGSRESVADKRFGAEAKRADRSARPRTATSPPPSKLLRDRGFVRVFV